jgi:hypothetical protein
MNVGTVNKTVQFHFWEYISQIFGTVQQNIVYYGSKIHNTINKIKTITLLSDLFLTLCILEYNC